MWQPPAVIAVTVLPASTPAVSTATGTFESVVLLLPELPVAVVAPAGRLAVGHRTRVVVPGG